MRVARGRLQAIQFSTSSPRTRPKSFTLLVTTTAPRLRACAPISRSFEPISWPLRLSSARIEEVAVSKSTPGYQMVAG